MLQNIFVVFPKFSATTRTYFDTMDQHVTDLANHHGCKIHCSLLCVIFLLRLETFAETKAGEDFKEVIKEFKNDHALAKGAIYDEVKWEALKDKVNEADDDRRNRPGHSRQEDIQAEDTCAELPEEKHIAAVISQLPQDVLLGMMKRPTDDTSLDSFQSATSALSGVSKAYVDDKHAEIKSMFTNLVTLLNKQGGKVHKPDNRPDTLCSFCKPFFPKNPCPFANDEKKCWCSKKFEGTRPKRVQARMDKVEKKS